MFGGKFTAFIENSSLVQNELLKIFIPMTYVINKGEFTLGYPVLQTEAPYI